MDYLALVIVLGSTTFLFTYLISAGYSRPRKIPFPPGPRGLPFFGSVHELYKASYFSVLDRWAKRYGQWHLILDPRVSDALLLGPIVHFKTFDRHVISVSSSSIGRELLTARDKNYCGKPNMVLVSSSYCPHKTSTSHNSLIVVEDYAWRHVSSLYASRRPVSHVTSPLNLRRELTTTC